MPAQPVDVVDAVRLRYPEHLPVVERREDILAAIRDHQVVVIAGETGSGKTTQIPKMCLELGLGGSGGQIGHTQPRRIAARSVAERIAEELQLELGDLVGYQVRFTDHSSATGTCADTTRSSSTRPMNAASTSTSSSVTSSSSSRADPT